MIEARHRNRAFDAVFKLADVARPVVSQQSLGKLRRQLELFNPRVAPLRRSQLQLDHLEGLSTIFCGRAHA
jgi:hypothetical protein